MANRNEEPEFVKIEASQFEEIKGQLLEQDYLITRLMSQPLILATIVKGNKGFNLKAFEKNDRMLIVDKALNEEDYRYGKIASNGVDKDGFVQLECPNGEKLKLNVGLNKNLPQVKLIGKDDGTNVVIAVDSKLLEVHGLPDKKFKSGEVVKVNIETRQIHEQADFSVAGEIGHIKNVIDDSHIEVSCSGGSRVVLHSLDSPEIGDKVMIDLSNTVCIQSFGKDHESRFSLLEDVNVTWDDIAGLEEAKSQLIEAVELPYTQPELFKFYNQSSPKGALLYGPPGNGKTLIGCAVANAIARIHGVESRKSGYIYVKGPELLNMWLGNTEDMIRSLFAAGRSHFKKHGYPATMFIDEGDSILGVRGDKHNHTAHAVPMFLSEMDGIYESHVFVLIATNRPKDIDPAILREGRIDRHIRIGRPTSANIGQYLKIHMKNKPLAKDTSFAEVSKVFSRELYSDKYNYCRIRYDNNDFYFGLKDIVSGAMIKSMTALAASSAMKRDMASGKSTGMTIRDFESVFKTVHNQHADLNMSAELDDFCEMNQIVKSKITVHKIK